MTQFCKLSTKCQPKSIFVCNPNFDSKIDVNEISFCKWVSKLICIFYFTTCIRLYLPKQTVHTLYIFWFHYLEFAMDYFVSYIQAAIMWISELYRHSGNKKIAPSEHKELTFFLPSCLKTIIIYLHSLFMCMYVFLRDRFFCTKSRFHFTHLSLYVLLWKWNQRNFCVYIFSSFSFINEKL